MDNESPYPNQRRWCWRKVSYTIGCNVPILIVFLVFLLALGFRIYSGVMLERELNAIRARGEPVTLRGVQDWPIRFAGTNGYPALEAYLDAMQVYHTAFAAALPPQQTVIITVADLEIPQYKDSAETYREYYPLIEEIYAPSYALLDVLSEHELFRYPTQYEDAYEASTPRVMEVAEADTVLQMIGCWQAYEGRNREALATAARLVLLSRTVETEPMMIDCLIRYRILMRAFRVCLHLLQNDEIDPEVLQRMQALLEGIDIQSRQLQNVFTTELAMGMSIDMQDMANAGFLTATDIENIPLYLYGVFLLPADKRELLALYERIPRDEAKWLAYMRSDEQPWYRTKGPGFYPLITMIARSPVDMLIQNHFRLKAKKALLLAGISIRLDELAGKPLPPIPGLLPGTVDPFTSQPLRIAQRDDGQRVIYSLGANGVEDEGWKTNHFHYFEDAECGIDEIALRLPPLVPEAEEPEAEEPPPSTEGGR